MHMENTVQLSDEQRRQLLDLTRKGKLSARKLNRAHMLLALADGARDDTVETALHVSHTTLWRTRKRFAQGGLEAALNERPRPGADRKLDGKQEAFLVALACSHAPEGREHWTMQLLADRLVQLAVVDEISDETVRRVLNKGEVKPWLKEEWCIPSVSPEFVWHMEDVLDLYAEAEDPARPVVCFDERPCQLL
jgi:transposase